MVKTHCWHSDEVLAFWWAFPKSSHAVKVLQWEKNQDARHCGSWPGEMLSPGNTGCPAASLDTAWFPFAAIRSWHLGTSLVGNKCTHQCLCCCMNVLHVLSSQRDTCSCRATRHLSMVQNVRARRFARFLLAKASPVLPLPTEPPKLLLLGQFSSAQLSLDSVRVYKCRALWSSAWFLTSFPPPKCFQWVTAISLSESTGKDKPLFSPAHSTSAVPLSVQSSCPQGAAAVGQPHSTGPAWHSTQGLAGCCRSYGIKNPSCISRLCFWAMPTATSKPKDKNKPAKAALRGRKEASEAQ